MKGALFGSRFVLRLLYLFCGNHQPPREPLEVLVPSHTQRLRWGTSPPTPLLKMPTHCWVLERRSDK